MTAITTAPALAPTGTTSQYLTGLFDDPRSVNERIDWAQDKFHLISPSTMCPVLPPGCAVTFSVVKINEATETYNVGGKRGLSRVALVRLSNTAGICWDRDRSGRVDDGAHPYYVHWHVAGVRRDLSGYPVPFDGDCQMDLRAGSAQVNKVLESIKREDYNRNPIPIEIVRARGLEQLRDMRAKILEHAQSKAQCRAIRFALGTRAYSSDELRLPFVVARLVFTGRDEDPRMEAENKRAVRAMMLGGADAMFGPAPTGRALPIAHRAAALPTGATRDYEEAGPDDDSMSIDDGSTSDGHPSVSPEYPFAVQPPQAAGPVPQAAPGPQSAAPAANAAPAHHADHMPAPASASGFTAPYGRDKGKAIEDMGDENLEWLRSNIANKLASGEMQPRFVESNRAILAAIDAERARRAAAGGDVAPPF